MKKCGKAFAVLMGIMVLFTVISRAAASFTVAQVTTEQPQARKITHTVTGDGVVENLKEQPVYVPEDVLVDDISVREGQSVKKGQTLARLNKDSLKEKIQTLSDEIKELQLENDALASAQSKKAADRKKAVARAKEDYETTVETNKRAVKEAKKNVKETKKETKKEQKSNYKKQLEELKSAVKEAKKAYENALAQQESELREAKRAVENAQKIPSEDYSDSITQIELNQKERTLEAAREKFNELVQKLKEVQGMPEEEAALNEQIKEQKKVINDLSDELTAAKLQQQAKRNEASSQENERKQTLARATEDYEAAVEKNETLVAEAKTAWEEAQKKLQKFEDEESEDTQKDTAVKEAQKNVTAAIEQQKEQKRAAARALEDAKEGEAVDHTIEKNELSIAQKQQELRQWKQVQAQGGNVAARMNGMIQKIQITVGEKTADTAAFMIANTSKGLRFTTTIPKEDADYISEGDRVTLSVGEQKYEDMKVISLKTQKDASVTVTVYVPKKTIAVGAQASMEAVRTSDEYRRTIPVTALHMEQQNYFVYTMEQEDTILGRQYVAKKIRVSVKEKSGEYAAISEENLSAEDAVIVTADGTISAGETVRLQEEGVQ